MKKKYFIILAALGMLLLSACSNEKQSGNSTDNEGDTGEKENIELSFTTWGNEQHTEMYNELLKGFYEKNPHIKVKIESIPFPDYQQKMSVLAAGNELPDVGWVSEQMVPQFMENNILSDISDFEEDADFNMEDFIPSTLELWKKDGRLFG